MTKINLSDELKQASERQYFDALKKLPKTFWNGVPCKVEFVWVKILPEKREGTKMMWYLPLAGTERQALAVIQKGYRFLIDNHDGQGFAKVTGGNGMWTSGHRSYGAIEEIGRVSPDLWVLSFDKLKHDETEKIVNEYWSKEDPEGFERMQNFTKMILNMNTQKK